MNTFGERLRLTTFGESHGKALGGIIDGFPPGFKIDFNLLYKEVEKRRPGNSILVSARDEKDFPEFLSGISDDGFTLGTPIGFIIRNTDTQASDYRQMTHAFRPNHADYSYYKRYGISPQPGGGRASARETANWTVAGALCSQWLSSKNINIEAALVGVGDLEAKDVFEPFISADSKEFHLKIDSQLQRKFEELILEVKKNGDSVGGKVGCVITGLPPGIGNPVFDKLQSRLGAAMMSINAAKGFEYGIGFKAANAFGSATADMFISSKENNECIISTSSNFSGGIQGGISNGMPIYFSVAFKPTPTLLRDIPTVDMDGNKCEIKCQGRHDPCVAVRAVQVVKSMASLVIADFLV